MFTFGFELEVVTAFNNQIVDKTQALNQVANVIKSTGRQADVFLPGYDNQPNYSIWNVTVDATIEDGTSSMG